MNNAFTFGGRCQSLTPRLLARRHCILRPRRALPEENALVLPPRLLALRVLRAVIEPGDVELGWVNGLRLQVRPRVVLAADLGEGVREGGGRER